MHSKILSVLSRLQIFGEGAIPNGPYGHFRLPTLTESFIKHMTPLQVCN